MVQASWRNCGVPVFGDIGGLTGQRPEQHAVTDAALSRCPPASAVQQAHCRAEAMLAKEEHHRHKGSQASAPWCQHHGLSMLPALSAAVLEESNDSKCGKLHDLPKQGARDTVWKHRDLDLHLWKNGPSRLPPPECSAWTTVVLSGLEYHNLQTVLTAEPLLPWKAFCPQQYWREMTALQVH